MEDSARNSFPFPETDGWELILKSHVPLSGVVLAVAPYLDQYILTCAGNTVKFFSCYFVKWWFCYQLYSKITVSFVSAILFRICKWLSIPLEALWFCKVSVCTHVHCSSLEQNSCWRLPGWNSNLFISRGKVITNIRVSLNKAHPLLYVCMHVGCT